MAEQNLLQNWCFWIWVAWMQSAGCCLDDEKYMGCQMEKQISQLWWVQGQEWAKPLQRERCWDFWDSQSHPAKYLHIEPMHFTKKPLLTLLRPWAQLCFPINVLPNQCIEMVEGGRDREGKLKSLFFFSSIMILRELAGAAVRVQEAPFLGA